MRQTLLFFLLAYSFTVMAQPDTVITVNVENEGLRRYMEEVQYVSLEDASRVMDYLHLAPFPHDCPTPAVVSVPETDADGLVLLCSDSADYASGKLLTFTLEKGIREKAIYNLVPQQKYYYKIMDGDNTLTQGEIHTEGQVRMIYVPGARNVRDMGGWKTADGKRIKYGKLYRGSELNGQHEVDSATIEMLKEQLEIQAELDMRAWYDTLSNVSAFGFRNSFTGDSDYPPYYYTSNSGMTLESLSSTTYQYRWRRQFTFIVNNLRHNRNVYYHCVWGADRTGYLALFLEGLLGVEYDGLVKDYELTSFTSDGREKSTIDPVIDTIMTFDGNTLQEKFNTFFLRTIKTTQKDIDYFRQAMLEEVKGNGNDDTGDNNGDDDNPATAIVSLRNDNDMAEPTAIYDLRGRKAMRNAKKGLYIEVSRDGMVRKVVR